MYTVRCMYVRTYVCACYLKLAQHIVLLLLTLSHSEKQPYFKPVLGSWPRSNSWDILSSSIHWKPLTWPTVDYYWHHTRTLTFTNKCLLDSTYVRMYVCTVCPLRLNANHHSYFSHYNVRACVITISLLLSTHTSVLCMILGTLESAQPCGPKLSPNKPILIVYVTTSSGLFLAIHR